MSQLYSNSIFWIDIEKIKPNPFQPRREFDEARLRDLADSIRQYGILQPLTVSRIEIVKEDEGIVVEYELIAGERRLRASKLAGLTQVPAIIRVGDDNMAKLELSIIENLQREDLNAVERARAFFRLVEEFKFNHTQIGQKMGKSREYVSNTLRLLALPQEMLDALSAGKISEGHTRPILMLSDRPDEQSVLFKEIMWKKLTVRDAEKIARKIAFDKVQETLGTRVHIERKENGGYITIDFFTNDDLRTILGLIKSKEEGGNPNLMLENFISQKESEINREDLKENQEVLNSQIQPPKNDIGDLENIEDSIKLMEDRTNEEIKKAEEDIDLYNIKNFSI
ncbi:MAG: ParB-like protein partition protein [Candidatus Nomurabacteria bacterium GW2011_GWF1_34_20]|nr:MAG: ParB-like protein partition protein [Candidatus Nomurabacteria bacterium GW2011_GWF1_34_20]